MDLDQIWKAALGELEVRLSPANFGMWFKDTLILDFKNSVATIATPNAFNREWIRDKYDKEIFLTLKKHLPAVTSVQYVVASRKDASPRVVDIPAPRKKASTSERPINNTLSEQYVFDRFVVGKTNRFAASAAKAVAEKPGSIHNPLFLYGGVGLGKTHLAQAVGTEIYKKDRDKKIVYVTCETFTNDFVSSISSGKMKEFKKNYREVDVLIVDDIQFIANKEGSQEEFFHTYNTLHQTNRQIIITADKPPKDITALEDRLKSRFGAGLMVDIQPPDLETRIAILRSKAEEMGAKCSDDVVAYIAQNVRANVRDLTGALNKIIVHAQLYKEEPTTSLCTELLKDVFTSNESKASVDKIMNAISRHFNIPISDIVGHKRHKALSNARQITMYLLRHETGMSYPLIGRELGDRDHTTIMHGEKTIIKNLTKNAELKSEITAIRERIHGTNP